MEAQTQGTEPEQRTESAAAHQNQWAVVAGLPCTLSVELSIPGTTIANLLELEVGTVVDSRHAEGAPLPVWVNGVTIGWVEFDVGGKHVAVRITEVR